MGGVKVYLSQGKEPKFVLIVSYNEVFRSAERAGIHVG
jgi:hypothetical protein